MIYVVSALVVIIAIAIWSIKRKAREREAASAKRMKAMMDAMQAGKPRASRQRLKPSCRQRHRQRHHHRDRHRQVWLNLSRVPAFLMQRRWIGTTHCAPLCRCTP